jgi:hypothetical protein
MPAATDRCVNFQRCMVYTWILKAMLFLAFPAGTWGVESREEHRARYESIAADMAAAIETERPVLGSRRRTAATLLAVTYHESGWKYWVDMGVERGDGGRSWCLAQLHVGSGKTREGWTGPDLVEDRVKCFRAAIALLRASVWTCANRSGAHPLAAYASGSCTSGIVAATRHQYTADRLIARIPWETEKN